MSGGSLGVGSILESSGEEQAYWHRVIPAVGVLLVLGAVAKITITLIDSGLLLEAVFDLILIGTPGVVMLYVGTWLPTSGIDREFYPRIVLWTVSGVAVMGVVLGLRVLHPGVAVQYSFGTQAIMLAIGSIAGLGIGVHKAQALTHARTIEEQNDRLRRTERRLEDTVTELEDSNERLEQFAHVASHDLQEPLRMVSSYLRLVEDRYGDELDEDCTEFIEFAVGGAERMRAMIDGLLEYSRVETQDDSFEAVDLDAVLDDVLTDLQFKIDETDATITREPLPTVRGDGRQLQQVFQNLLSNAIEYSGDEPPEIHVSSAREDGEWTISVRDEGIGIDTEDADDVFDIFQRLHSMDEHAGSGIGLALCKRIVERHGVRASDASSSTTGSRSESVGGEIRVDSEPGEGSTFFITLPSRTGSAASTGVETQE